MNRPRAPGQGSSFRVLLPVPAEEANRAACLGSAPAAAAATPKLHGRVLLVEDDPMVGGCRSSPSSGRKAAVSIGLRSRRVTPLSTSSWSSMSKALPV